MYRLFAWAAPAANRNVADHTWVTSYDNREREFSDIANVVDGGADFWFCWGMYRSCGKTRTLPDGYLGDAPADRALARCLVLENVPSQTDPRARGTIFRYGIDGVCHQLANQVLYATAAVPPLTVSRARGYSWSEFVYGTYGLQESAWRNKLQGCTSRVAHEAGTGVSNVINPTDGFEERAAALLGRDAPHLLAELLRIRAHIHQFLENDRSVIPPSASDLNRRNSLFIAEAAQLLGPDRFRQLFGFEAAQGLDLIDPEIVDAQRKADAPFFHLPSRLDRLGEQGVPKEDGEETPETSY